nr:MAG TPA: KilAC domain protein [Caudoviricetes sp.]DAG32329.1 MAG TPA: KilAC domain protein [Caudoviricetes sp.]
MNELSIIHQNGVDVIDSRSVAEAIGKEHRHLIRDIRNYVEILEKATERKSALSENPEESNEPKFGLVEKSTESNFGLSEKSNERKLALVGKNDAGNFSLSDFFIPSTYTDSKGEQRPCYLLTKKGCDMVANKLTGEKGVLFTAAYVTAFEKMRRELTCVMPQDFPSALRALADAEEQKLKLLAENQAMRGKADYFDALVDRNLLTGFRETAKELGIKQNKLISFLLDNGYVYRNQRGKLLPYEAKNDGLFEVKEFVNDNNGFSSTQTLITPKGRETFRLLLLGGAARLSAGKEAM